MKNENKLDQFFNRGLKEPETPFNELDWEKMEGLLDAKPGKRVLPLWVLAASGVAASLLILIFFMFNNKQPITGELKNPVQASVVEPKITPEVPNEQKEKKLASAQQLSKPMTSPVSLGSAAGQGILKATISNEPSVAIQESAAPMDEDAVVSIAAIVEPTTSATTQSKPIFKARSPFVFSIIAAPDISSSPANLSSKVSTNIGLLGTYFITKKISISTGAVYGRKLYDYGGISLPAYGNPGKKWEVDADCKVLDIPLNLNYQLFNNKNNSITVNTGLSSYFMLNERYKYINNDGINEAKVSVFEIVNQNQHVFGVANLSLSFNHQITNKLNIGVQPFVKIPLTGLGYQNSKLRSTGVAFSLNLSLSKSINTN